ncbi:hypothetical protein PO878_14770 [Iamia majanohamensis]|uniref:Uncharacterized protein n=1 Tax=Iamia majanohamensis TaxID=467976 RepID=A0AAE9Y418_9ACTN|nr:hypothetical protein [Iamia majanohamensis]WCO65764.1 hypothetical protein PO878_14770 [Iamia majanohamensis]
MPFFTERQAFLEVVADGRFGVLRPEQVSLIQQVQPFDESDREVARIVGLLIGLGEARDHGTLDVAAWAHGGRPEARVAQAEEALTCVYLGDGLLEGRRAVGAFDAPGLDADEIEGNPNIAFDLVATAEPWPADPDDNFQNRSASLLALGQTFLGLMAQVSAGIPPSGQRRSHASFVRPMPASDWDKFRPDLEADGEEIAAALDAAEVDLALRIDPDGGRSMLVRVGDGFYGRPIAPATQLDPAARHGTAAEDASLRAAARWGLPDFVMAPQQVAKGGATRELGDGTVIVGRRGLAVQVKAREGTPGDERKEARWVIKKAADGARQAAGTVRSLRSDTFELINGRGRVLPCAGSEVDWVRVVIIDHPDPPSVDATPRRRDGDLPVVVVSRQDWEFLFEHLRSVSAVVDYVFRVSDQEPESLGREAVRYYELAQADESSPPRPPPKWAFDPGASHVPFPLLPKAPANAADTTGHTVFRSLLEDIATSPTERPEPERLKILALIDRFSVGERADLGRLMLSHLDDVIHAAQGTTLWRFRWVIQDEGLLQLGFGACNQLTDLHSEAFRQKVALRHHDLTAAARAAGASDEPKTVGVLLTPRYDGYRPWNTTTFTILGAVNFEPDDLAAMRQLWDSAEPAA